MVNCVEISAQAITNQIKDVVMPAPNASSLGKYGDIPVGYYSGIPNIGVPVHTLKQGPLTVPIGLNYHAGGLKVGETSSWVGLGWSLQAGGMISRTVQGKADEQAFGYMAIGQTLTVDANGCLRTVGNPGDETINPDISSGYKDGEPDIFSFAVGGYNGKFYIDSKGIGTKGQVVLIPKQDIKIDYELSTTAANGDPYRLKKFTMTTPDGTKYEFGDLGLGVTERAIEITENNDNLFWTASTWYLKKITSYDLTNTITFSYLPETYRYYSRMSGHNSFSKGGQFDVNQVFYNFSSVSNGYSLNAVDVIGCRLSSIQTQTETVTFKGSTREDLRFGVNAGSTQLGTNTIAGTEPKMLDTIKISTGTYCKDFILTHSYFKDLKTGHLSGQNDADWRLKLESVQEKSCATFGTVISIPAHVFTYYSKTGELNYLPNRFSQAIDHWGYYNDATNNPHSGLNIPNTQLTYSVQGASDQVINQGSSDRETNEAAMKWGTIESITYPTGGKATFDYEANTYWHVEEDHAPMSITRYFPSISCHIDPASSAYSTGAGNITRRFTANELNNTMYYKLERVGQASTPENFCGNSNDSYVEVYVFQDGTQVACGVIGRTNLSNSIPVTERLKLNTLFPCLRPNIYYTFALRTVYAGARFTLEKDAGQPVVAYNKKVGGLRIKTITTTDGTSTNPATVKTYNYDAENSSPTGKSSGVLYNKPQYSYQYRGMVGYCNGVTPGLLNTHFLIDQSIVPLSSFEGSHINYLAVREYNGTGNGYTLYQYTDEAVEPSTHIPFPYIQPRIEAGNVASKKQKLTNGTDVASETNTYKTETYEQSAGDCIKFNRYSADPVSTIYSFWRLYKIKTRALRLESVASVVDGVASSTEYGYNTLNLHYNPTSVTTTNSDGSTYCTKTYYAHEMNNTAVLGLNMVSVPLKTEQYYNGVLKSATETVYSGTIPRPSEIKQRNRDGVWETKFTINAYNAAGLPTQTTRQGFTLSETYNWDALNRLTSKWFGLMSSSYTYKPNTRLLDVITDENKFKTKFNYDGLMRLQDSQKFFADDAQTLRSTTAYDYVFGGLLNPTCNKVSSTTTFVGIAKTITNNQIFDGLGRVIQSTKVLQGPNEEHIKSAVTYDALGRTDRSYQPFIATNINCAEAVPNGTLFVRADYELSPLSRPIKQYAEDGKSVTMIYGTNSATDVKFITVNLTNPELSTTTTNYAAYSLYKTTIINENGKSTDVFKDKLGRVVLTRKFLDNTAAGQVDTYNVYDDYGNLIMVIPPGAITGSAISADLVFTYKYNNKHLLCEKKMPGAEVQRYYYNLSDQLTFMQDGNMRATHPNRYLATEYDQYGRVWHTTWVQTGSPTTDALLADFSPIRTDWMNDYYYHEHPVTHAVYTRPPAVRTRTIPSSGGALKTGDKQIMWRSTQYDDFGMPSWGCPEYLRANNCDDYVWNSDGSLASGTKYNNWKDNNQVGFNQVFYSQRYTYDRSRRLKTTEQQLWGPNGTGGSFFAPWVELSALKYNYKGQVEEKNIGRRTDIYAAKSLQSIDYTYNQRGWLTAINQMPLSYHNQIVVTTGNMSYITYAPNATYNIVNPEGSVDLFSESIRYDNPDAGISNIGTPQYNGNISQAVWQIAGREQQAFTYKYDNIDRLLEGEYTDIHDPTAYGGLDIDLYSTDNKFGEKLTYDLRGNILSLKRNGMTAAGLNAGSVVTGTFGQIDDLVYNYNSQNQVTNIADNAPAADRAKGFRYNGSTSTAYTYDANGNLKSDLNKGITNIVYNYLNLPQRIEFLSSAAYYKSIIEFVYDGTGMKLRKTATLYSQYPTTIMSQEVTDYMDGFEYKNDKIERIHHAEGVITLRAKQAGEGNEFVGMGGLVWQYEYVLKDHLGNTRVTFADVNNNNTIEPTTEINQINHYYPFGLNMEGNWNGASADAKNKYQYNDKELQTDFGLNWNDYGARHYDAATARFTTIDPLADIFAFQSPYAYAANNPIKYIDFMGMGPTGADGMTNEQWMSATNPANNSSQAAGGKTAASGYQQQNRSKETELRRKGQSREIEDDDIAASGSGSNIVWEGFYTSTTNTVTGFHFDCGCGGVGEPPCPYPWNSAISQGLVGYGTLTIPTSFIDGSFRLTNGIYNGSRLGLYYYPSAWTGGSVARITTYNIPRIGTNLGLAGLVVGTSNDFAGMLTHLDSGGTYGTWSGVGANGVAPPKFGLNLGMGAIGVFGGGYGAIGSGIYFAIDNFLGWNNAMNDYRSFQNKSREIGFPIFKY